MQHTCKHRELLICFDILLPKVSSHWHMQNFLKSALVAIWNNQTVIIKSGIAEMIRRAHDIKIEIIAGSVQSTQTNSFSFHQSFFYTTSVIYFIEKIIQFTSNYTWLIRLFFACITFALITKGTFNLPYFFDKTSQTTLQLMWHLSIKLCYTNV